MPPPAARTKDPLAEAIVAELKEFSADLLDQGLARQVATGPLERARAAGAETGGTQTALLSLVGSLTMLTPRLLRELSQRRFDSNLVESTTARPVRARLSRRACDYALTPDGLRPVQWVTLVPGEHVDPRPLRWLLKLLNDVRSLLAESLDRTEKSVAEARVSRRGASVWAEADASGLEDLLSRLQQARHALDRTERTIRGTTPDRLIPVRTLPDPYPATPAWASLRRLAARMASPAAFLPEHLQWLWGSEVGMADLAHLYQRWVGVRIVRELDAMGWELREDPTGTIFLGGKLTFHHEDVSFDLWIEPRLSREGAHPSGYRCVRGDDATPDYLFITPGKGGPAAFVLDATLASGPDELLKKGKYRDVLELDTLVRVAGCPVKRLPKLSWAASPAAYRYNKQLTRDGSVGVVPVSPLREDSSPLRAWLTEVTRHTLAWYRDRSPKVRPATARPSPPRTLRVEPLSTVARPLRRP